MTPRERAMAAVGGGVPDRQPVMAWPYGNDRSDIRCFADDTMPDRIEPSDRISLVEVVNPFGLAIQKEASTSIDFSRKTPEGATRP